MTAVIFTVYTVV